MISYFLSCYLFIYLNIAFPLKATDKVNFTSSFLRHLNNYGRGELFWVQVMMWSEHLWPQDTM